MALFGKACWENFISADSEVSRDVFFDVRGEDGKSSKIGAHKVLLAGISPVFKKMFYGPMKETREEIEVNETSPETFSTMINYIYARDPQKVLDDINSPKTLCELFALGDYYDILMLKTGIWRSVPKFEISRENLIETATVAKRFKELFVDLGTELQMKCLQFSLTTSSNLPDDIRQELMEVGKSTLQLSGITLQLVIRSKPFVMS